MGIVVSHGPAPGGSYRLAQTIESTAGHVNRFLGVFAQPPLCGARHDRGWAESPTMCPQLAWSTGTPLRHTLKGYPLVQGRQHMRLARGR